MLDLTETTSPPPIETSVLIVGSGSAGLCAAAWLARLNIDFIILEKRDGPLAIGQADGVQCRTVEVFESFGLSDHLVRDAYWVNEVCFWSVPDSDTTDGAANGNTDTNKIVRTGRTADVAEGLSWQPHVILNQARLNAILLDDIRAHGGREVDYGVAVQTVSVDASPPANPHAHAVTVTANQAGQTRTYRAKFVLGADGAHSSVRHSLGYAMVGDTSDAVWGVMDVYARTNFPDIRKKTTIRARAGNLLIIPREGGALVRMYIELPAGTRARAVALPDLHAAAARIFAGYDLEFVDTFWWSAYAIGQRVAERFDAAARVFLSGDACHTHSPKAGQGMNVSLQDGYNMGWKLAYVLQGRAPPELLRTYVGERELTAKTLIDFDREFTKLFSLKSEKDSPDAAKRFREYFIRSGRYTAGLTSRYEDSELTSSAKSRERLATNVTVGMRFPSAQVVRFCDAKAMQLARALQADGRFRIIVFGGDIRKPQCKKSLDSLAAYLSSEESPIYQYTKPEEDVDSVIEPILVLSGERVKMEQEMIPDVFWPVTGKWKLRGRRIHARHFKSALTYNSRPSQDIRGRYEL